MKSRTLATAIIVTLTTIGNMSLFAVGFSYGVKAGGNLAVFGGQDSYQDGAYECKYKIGFSSGLFASISSTNVVAVESAVLFSLKGTKVELDGLEGYEYDNLYYIEIPLVLKIYPPLPLSVVRLNIFAGPYFGIDVLNRYRTTDEVKGFYQLLGVSTKGEYENVKTFDWGVVAGLGADIGRVLLEVSYSMAATSFDDSMYDYALSNWVFTLMFGYRLR